MKQRLVAVGGGSRGGVGRRMRTTVYQVPSFLWGDDNILDLDRGGG